MPDCAAPPRSASAAPSPVHACSIVAPMRQDLLDRFVVADVGNAPLRPADLPVAPAHTGVELGELRDRTVEPIEPPADLLVEHAALVTLRIDTVVPGTAPLGE